MRPPGIHNKYEPKKADPPPGLIERDTFDTEGTLHSPPTVTLDGDSYALRFMVATLDTVRDRLFDLLYDVNNTCGSQLNDLGVSISEEEDAPCTYEMSLKLKTTKGWVIVRTDTANEVEAFRRIGYALASLPVHKITAEHKVKVIERR